jgi:hypothetical protein
LRTEQIALDQKGPAEIPAAVEVADTVRTLPIPKGSQIVSNAEAHTITVLPAAPTTLTETTRKETATGPQSFQPPAPPTPAEIATGRATLYFQFGIAGGLALALFGLVRGWDFVMYGGSAIAGGCTLALLIDRNPLMFALIGVGLALCIAGPLLWHTKLKRVIETEPAN